MTYSDKILTYLVKEELKSGKAVFNTKVAKKKFRSVPDIDGTVMRTARQLYSNKLLKRVSAGEYALTAKGRRVVTN